jgi:L-fucose/D-arabinose isomerase
MREAAPLTIGLLATISPELHDVWAATTRPRGLDRLARARALLEGMGARVLDPGELTTDTERAARHGRELHAQGAQLLVVYVAMWSYGSSVVAAAAESGLPVVIWTDTDVQYVGVVGASVCRGSLDEAGITNCLVYGDIEDPATQRELAVRCLGATAGTRLRGQTYGLMGSRSLGMYTAAVDPNQWRRQFGVDVESWDQLEVIERAREVPAAEVERHLAWTRREYGAILVKDEVMRAAIRMYLASREIVAQRGFDFVAVRCLPETPSTYTTFCYAIALLNDTSDADGPKKAICCACESDSNGALTMQILKHLGGAPVLFGDVRHVDLAKGEVWISNCGAQATQLARSRKDVRWIEHGFQEFKWKIGGAAPQHISRPGHVTLARLTRIAGDYIMLIAGGEALDEPPEKLGETYWEFSPHSFVKLDADPRAFAQELRCNHLHMVYGDYVPHLIECCRVLGIRPIVVSSR